MSREGSVLGEKYRLGGVVGEGGSGVVHAGVHLWTGRPVAVKVLAVDEAEDPTLVERFLVEARTAASLRHPNVVEVLDMGRETDGTVYLVLEYLEGESLARRLERSGRLTVDEVTAFVLPVMDALADAHDAGIVHRDVKPENIFLAADPKHVVPRPKLLDFGVAKVLSGTAGYATRVGSIVGTPAYMSPEQAAGSSIGPASDIWSVGVVLFECLSGVRPFQGDSLAATLLAVIKSTPPSLRSVAPTLPFELTEVVDRALARAPSSRWPTMRAFAVAMAEALDPDAPTRVAMEAGQDATTIHQRGPASAFQPMPATRVAQRLQSAARVVPPTLRLDTGGAREEPPQAPPHEPAVPIRPTPAPVTPAAPSMPRSPPAPSRPSAVTARVPSVASTSSDASVVSWWFMWTALGVLVVVVVFAVLRVAGVV